MKTILFTISILFLSATAYAQRAVNPVRISFAEYAEQSQDDLDFTASLRTALNKHRDLVVAAKRADYTIATAATVITRHDGAESVGYGVAVLVVETKTGAFKLSIKAGPTFDAVASDVAQYLDNELFQRRKR